MNLKELRKNAGIRRKEMARLMGVTLRTLTYWESGQKILPTLRLTRFAALCEVGVGDVVDAIAETVGER